MVPMVSAHARLDQALASFQTNREARTAEWKTVMRERRAELRIAWGEWKAARSQVRKLA